MNEKLYTSLDQEVVALAAVWDLIGSMVHYGHFEGGHRIDEAMLMFKTRECSKLFLIILADFLSYPRDGTFGLTRSTTEGSLGQTYLGYLDKVAAKPSFEGDTSLLANSVKSFSEWLDGYVEMNEVWLPSINRNGPLRVRRMTYLKICGTSTKHGFTRLGRVVDDIRQVLSENGTEIDEGQSYLVLPEFQERFRDDIFIASSTTIAWFLNEIRWGIYQYLSTEYRRTYRATDIIQEAQMYEYDVPTSIVDPLIRSMYWDLMNDVRSPPYFPRFSVQKYLRQEY